MKAAAAGNGPTPSAPPARTWAGACSAESGLRVLLFAAGLVFLALACALLAQAPPPRAGTPALAGGCAPATSPYLEADSTVRHAAISFCAGGDAATGRMSLYLPAGTLDRHRLVVAGYLDGEAVRAHVRREGAPPLAIVQRAAETWTPAEVAIPEAWRSVPLEVELVDAGEGHAQWGGLGLVAIAPTPAIERLDAILWLAAAAAFCLLAASPSRRQPYPAGAPGVLWRGGRALIIAGLAAAALLLGDAWYRNDAAGDWIHPDQEIPIKVMQAMHAHDDLNTDFARADIPGYFHEYRYNFSGYILLSYLTIRATAPEAFASDEELRDRLLEISRWCAAATLALCLLLLARHAGIVHAVLGTAAIAVVPQLYQDAHYVRLESMSTLLFTVCFALATLRPRGAAWRMALLAAIGLVAGLLSTIKFTYAICTLFCIGAALPAVLARSGRAERLRLLTIAGGVSLAGFAAGFCAGAPAIVADLPGYLAGIEALNRQYGGGHPPHGFIEPGMGKQLALIAGYYFATLGLPLILLHGLGYFRQAFSPGKAAYGAILGLTLLAFVMQNAFFERNFSPYLPAFVMLSVVGMVNLRHWLQVRLAAGPALVLGGCLGALFVLGLAAPLGVTDRLSGYFREDDLAARAAEIEGRQRWAAHALGAVRTETLRFEQVFQQKYPPTSSECVLHAGIAYNDDWSRRYYRHLPAAFRVYDRIASDFDDLPVSTLQPYHSPGIRLFYEPAACPGAIALHPPSR